MQKTVHYVVGLMSGTSIDGIDAAVVEITEMDNRIVMNLISFSTLAFSKDMKEKILELCDPKKATIEDISSMNMMLGELFAEAALMIIQKAGLSPDDILLISSHGQTIFHQPEPIVLDGKQIKSTLQIGDIGVIAERTGIMTVGDFRTRDMAAGGQGAPLVPYADFMLFKEKEFGRVLLNIGGISNITVLPKDCTEFDVIAYDTGPGNMIIDAFTEWATNGEQTYDEDGKLAAQGSIHEKWLEQLLEHSYFTLPSPKSTGREVFGREYAQQLWGEADHLNISSVDKLTTVTALTAKTIAMEISKYIETSELKEVLVSGGGCFNRTLMKQLSDYLPNGISVKGTNEVGMSPDAKEAMTFALLGYQFYMKRANNLPSATGANHSVVMGKMAW